MDKKRILVIDDSEAIHTDFYRILCPEPSEGKEELDLLEEALFGPEASEEKVVMPTFELDSAFQGQEGVAKVQEAVSTGRPYAVVFLDYRMPPGWNGLETLRHLRKVAPSQPVVLCSAYSDYSWEDIVREFGTEHLVELRKPFNSQELHEIARSLTEPGA
ncbi:response regulator [Stigmatella hybrida]|uniref:response regulator n=1 Tax=Stigmatella hybrida TaxID=394097 RepID=UPI001CDA56A1|nr:response regulator [Stigmatella hybrida]